MIRQFELVERVRAYNPNTDEDLLNRAYVFGIRAHGSQRRASGEPYFNHPVEVAAILTELRLDDATIVTALLHDTIEDTDVAYGDIKDRFGSEIAEMVNGVTKLSKLEPTPSAHPQADNLRNLFLAMARDPRVLLVKMADRLHNMRTLHHLRPEKRERIARETLEIFAPLAGRMGMQEAREELEDRAFKVINPDAHLSLTRRIEHLRVSAGEDVVTRITDLLSARFAEDGVQAEVSGREKRPYSVWRKMQRKSIAFEQLSDVVAFRALVADERACYAALGAVHRGFAAVPGRFKDYVSNPKGNGYRSLHTTVVGPAGARIEMQIRTHEMDEVAESGVAAHWAYKQGVRVKNPFAVDPFKWLRDLVDRVDRLEDGEIDAEAFVEDAKMEMLLDQVYCFTPRGDVIGLPAGATALDFAYAVHTNVGHTAVGAKIDGERAALSAALRNGQTVEVIQSAGQRPTPIFFDMVKTGRARAAIRRDLRAQERADAARLGERVVERVFERNGVTYSRKSVAVAAQRLGVADADALLADVGAAQITAVQVFDAVYPDLHLRDEPATGVGVEDPDGPHSVVARSAGVGRLADATREPEILRMPTAPCCRPLPGERIVALREPKIGFRLHAIDCPALASFEDAPERWLDVTWAPDAAAAARHVATLELTIANEPGSLGQTCAAVGQFGANIDDLTFVDRKPDYFRLKIDVEVRDVRHLSHLITALDAQSVVAEVRRRRPDDRTDGVTG